jgi:hypothetical protein
VELDGILKLPDMIPTKFIGRCQRFEHGYFIESSIHPDIPMRSKESFKNGFWITQDDLTVRGGTRTVFGVPLDDIAWPLESSNVKVSYHGTAAENLDSIRKTSLRETFGQMGTGVYVGSFWKACRFAGRDQSYQFRKNPLVLRILCLRANMISFPRLEECTCELCELKTREQRRAAGHTLHFVDTCAELRIGQFSTGKWITQNEEWVIPQSFILRISEGVELKTESLARPNYDPLQRNIEIK